MEFRCKPSSSGGAATIVSRWMSSSATGKLFVFRAMTAPAALTTTLRAKLSLPATMLEHAAAVEPEPEHESCCS